MHDILIEGVAGVMAAAIVWNFKTLLGKSSKIEVAELRSQVEKLNEFIYKNVATKDDFYRLDAKIDKLIDRELGEKK